MIQKAAREAHRLCPSALQTVKWLTVNQLARDDTSKANKAMSVQGFSAALQNFLFRRQLCFDHTILVREIKAGSVKLQI